MASRCRVRPDAVQGRENGTDAGLCPAKTAGLLGRSLDAVGEPMQSSYMVPDGHVDYRTPGGTWRLPRHHPFLAGLFWGFGCPVDLGGVTFGSAFRGALFRDPWAADWRSIAEDWQAVGSDIRGAIAATGPAK